MRNHTRNDEDFTLRHINTLSFVIFSLVGSTILVLIGLYQQYDFSIGVLTIIGVLETIGYLALPIFALRFFYSPRRFRVRLILAIWPAYIFSIISTFASLYQQTGLMDAMGHKVEADKATALYFSCMTITTVGYGDIVPSKDSRLFTCLEALLGYFFLALTLALIINVIADVSKGKEPTD